LKNQKKINAALFGGSFDPPHIGHQMIVDTALKELDIDKLFIVPAYLNPFKKSFFAPPKKRYEWIKKLFKDYEKVEILDYEIKKDRAVPTIETVKHLYKIYNINKLYLIIGDDNLKSLHKWKDYEKLKEMVAFVIATRKMKEYPQNLKILKISANISSTKLRTCLDTKFLPNSISKDIIDYYKEKNDKQT
jgi:nicotinate-nucleotide adenylyltransferase